MATDQEILEAAAKNAEEILRLENIIAIQQKQIERLIEARGIEIAAKERLMGYTISANGKSITCKRCGFVSHNWNDVKNRYCGHCHIFHDKPWVMP